MKRILILLLVIVNYPSVLFGQGIDSKNGKAVYEDKDGETSIIWPGGSIFRVNTKDASMKIGYSHLLKEDVKNPFALGFDLSGKTYDGVLSLISKGQFSSGIKTNVFVSKYFQKDIEKSVSWISLKMGYEGSKFNLIYLDSSYNEQVNSKAFEGFNVSLGWNIIPGKRNDLLLGFSAGYKHSNNYNSLDEIEMKEVRTFTDIASGSTRTLENKISGRTGDYKETNTCILKEDLFWIATPRLGLYQYFRLQGPEFKKMIPSLGAGAYLLNDKDVLSSRAGIIFEANDFTHLSSDAGKHFFVSLIVGVSFGHKEK